MTSAAPTAESGPPVFLVLAGPAGSGKTTLCDRMVREVPGFSRVITTTTRPPRPGELNGVHYHFLTPIQFDDLIAADAFIEWAWVHGTHRYGPLASSILDPLSAGGSLIINLDVQGVANIKRAAAANPILERHLATVFIEVPLEELRRRMRARGQDSESEIEHRLRTAERELAEAPKFDFRIQSRGRGEDFQALIEVWKEARRRIKESGARSQE